MQPFDPMDPYGLASPPAWTGAWPPDASWDEPGVVPALPAAQPVASPEAAQARAAADELFAEPGNSGSAAAPPVQLGQPRAVPEPGAEPFDESLIEMEPQEPDWSGLEAQPAGPAEQTLGEDFSGLDEPPDAGDIELEEPDAPGLTEEQQVAGLAELDPVTFADTQAKQMMARENRQAALQAEASARDREDAEANERIHREAIARSRVKVDAINAEADRLATEKVDPDGWRNSRTLFQTIAMYTAGIVGGLMQSRQGGPNQGLAMINDQIEKHIAAQQANLANRKDMLGRKQAAAGEEMNRADEDFRAEEAFRIAAWKRAGDDIDSEMAKYDPHGSRVMKLAEVRRGVYGQIAQGQEALRQRTIKEQIDIGAAMRAEEKHLADMAKTRAETAKLRGAGMGGGSGGGGSASASKVKRTASEWNSMFPGANVPDDGVPRTLAEYRSLGETGKSLTAPTAQEQEARNLAVTGPRGQLKQKDGSFYNPPTEAATKTRQQMYTGGQIIADLDRAMYLRDSVGGELGQLNSDERQEYDQIEQRVTLMAKGQHEGMSSDSDLKRLGLSLGVENLASFRSKSHGLKTAREAVGRQVNGWLAANNYTGEPVTWPNTQTKATKKTAKERASQDLIKSEAGNDPARLPTAAAAAGPVGYSAKALDWGIGKLEGKKSADPGEEKKMRAFVKGALKGDEASIQALKDIAEGSNSEAFRNQAAAALMAADFLRRTPDEDESASSREEDEAFLKEGD